MPPPSFAPNTNFKRDWENPLAQRLSNPVNVPANQGGNDMYRVVPPSFSGKQIDVITWGSCPAQGEGRGSRHDEAGIFSSIRAESAWGRRWPCLYRLPLRKGRNLPPDIRHPPILPSNHGLVPGAKEKASQNKKGQA